MTGLPAIGEKLWGDDEDVFQKKIRTIAPQNLRNIAVDFYENGYCVLAKALDNDVCDRAVSAYRRWCEKNGEKSAGIRGDGRMPRVTNLHAEKDAIKDLFVTSDISLAVQDMLFGYRSSVYTSFIFEYGTEQPLHIDTPVFRTSPEEFYFGVWCAFEDANEENGCLQVMHQGHRGCRVDQYEFAEFMYDDISEIPPSGEGIWSPSQNAVTQSCEASGKKVKLLEANKGDIVIWHPQLPHGGSKIRNENKSRMSIVFHVVPERTPVYQADVFLIEIRYI